MMKTLVANRIGINTIEIDGRLFINEVEEFDMYLPLNTTIPMSTDEREVIDKLLREEHMIVQRLLERTSVVFNGTL